MRPQIKRILIISIACFLFGVTSLGAGFYFLYMEGVQESEKKRDEVQKVRDDYRIKAAQVGLKREELRQVILQGDKALQQIPRYDEKEFDSFLEQLRDMAASTGVAIKPPKPSSAGGPRPGQPGATAMPTEIVEASYEVTATGEFRRLWDFLKVMENSVRFVKIESFTFSKNKDAVEATKDQTSLVLKVTVYSFKQPLAPVKAEAPIVAAPADVTTLPPK